MAITHQRADGGKVGVRYATRRSILGQLTLACVGCSGAADLLDVGLDRQRVEVAPAPGADVVIQAALDSGAEVILLKGTYDLHQPLILRTGARLYGAGSGLTRLVAAFSVTPEAADMIDNALVRVLGAATPVETTTLATSAPKDSRTLVLASALTEAEPGAWVRVSGANLIQDEYEMSDAAPLCEILPVGGADGVTLALDEATFQFHSVGVAVDVVEPAVDVEIQGLDVSAEGGTVAVGIALELAVDVRIQDVSGAGFSRSLIELGPGARSVRLRELRSRGQVNSLVFASTAMDVHIETVFADGRGERAHPLGIPRALLNFRHRCTSIVVTSGILEGGCIGIRTWGGHHIYFSDLLIRDMDPTAAVERDPLIQGGVVGVGIDSGAGPLQHAEFARDVAFVNVHIENCRQPSANTQASWYLHDVWGVLVAACSIVNKGPTASTPGSHMTGMIASDTSGVVESLLVQGVNYGLRTRNVTADLHFGIFEMHGTAGSGQSSHVALWLDHGVVPGGRGPQFQQLKLNNVPYYFYAGTDFDQFPDWKMIVREFYADGFEATDCVVGYHAEGPAFNMGEVAEIISDGSGTLLVSPQGPSTRNAVIVTGKPHSAGTRYLLAARCPTSRVHVLCTAGAVSYGDLLVASTAVPRRAEVNNDPPSPFVVLGKALESKPAGAEGLVLIGHV